MENSKEKQETKRSIKISESTHTKMSDIKGYYGISFTKQVDIAIKDYYEKMKKGQLQWNGFMLLRKTSRRVVKNVIVISMYTN